MKHTQKRWFASPMEEGSKKWGVYFSEDFSDTDFETGDFIQHAGMNTTVIADNLTEANACLIASVPEILEAIEMFIEGWDNFLSKTNIGNSFYSAREITFMNDIGIAMDKAKKATS